MRRHIIIIFIFSYLQTSFAQIHDPDTENMSLLELNEKIQQQKYERIREKVLKELGCEEIGEFREEKAPAMKNGKWGFINTKGQIVVPFIYDNVYPFSNGFASVEKDGFYGFINEEGKEICPLKYEEAYGFSDSRGIVNIDGLWGLMDENGMEVTPIKYGEMVSFTHGLYLVFHDGKLGFIDKAGTEIIPAKYERDDFDLSEIELGVIKFLEEGEWKSYRMD